MVNIGLVEGNEYYANDEYDSQATLTDEEWVVGEEAGGHWQVF